MKPCGNGWAPLAPEPVVVISPPRHVAGIPLPRPAGSRAPRRRTGSRSAVGQVCVERESPRLQYDSESMSLLFYDEILRGVESHIREHNWSLLITYLREATDPDLP